MKCQDVEIPSHHYFRIRGTSLIITMITLHQLRYVTPGSIKPLWTIIYYYYFNRNEKDREPKKCELALVSNYWNSNFTWYLQAPNFVWLYMQNLIFFPSCHNPYPITCSSPFWWWFWSLFIRVFKFILK